VVEHWSILNTKRPSLPTTPLHTDRPATVVMSYGVDEIVNNRNTSRKIMKWVLELMGSIVGKSYTIDFVL
jgi:hypothetical protein